MQALLISTVAPLGTATGWQDLQKRHQTEGRSAASVCVASRSSEPSLSGVQNDSFFVRPLLFLKLKCRESSEFRNAV